MRHWHSPVWYLLFALLLITSACSNPGIGESQYELVLSGTADPSNELLVAPSSTAAPSATLSPTLTQTSTITPTPTLTPHPVSIPALRQLAYPGSEITIEETLEPGENYSRFYVSYLSDGLKQYGLLTIPDGETPPTGWPAIVFNHGYIPPDVYRTTERYIAYVDWLARSGYIVFRIDYRGNDRSEGIPRGAYSDPGYTIDVLNAVASLKRFPPADNNRIGMWGHSMGGFLTLRAMVLSEDIKTGVIWAGVVGSYPDLLARWRRGRASGQTPTPSARQRWRSDWIAQYGTPEETPNSGIRSPPIHIWMVFPDQSSCTMVLQTSLSRWNYPKFSTRSSLRPAKPWNSTPILRTTTTYLIILALP
jgi:pimeloyl-ACP methyl ester carboxylesterase